MRMLRDYSVTDGSEAPLSTDAPGGEPASSKNDVVAAAGDEGAAPSDGTAWGSVPEASGSTGSVTGAFVTSGNGIGGVWERDCPDDVSERLGGSDSDCSKPRTNQLNQT